MTAIVGERVFTGSHLPRIQATPKGGTSRGPEMAQWAKSVLGVQLMPWQRHVLSHGCRVSRNRWQARTVVTLVARQNGKTELTCVRVLAGMALYKERLVVGAAQNRDIALESWRRTLELAEDAGLDVHGVARTNGREEFWIGDSRYKIVSSTRRGARGLSADLVVMDEVREYRDWDGWSALDKTRRARAGSQVWAISTEGDAGSVVLDALASQGREAAKGVRPVGKLAYFEWSAAPDLDRDSRTGWAQANPALGRLLEVATLEHELATDPPEVFETEVLCRRVTSLRPWLPEGSWASCEALSATVPDEAQGQVVFALDVGPELRHATIAAGWIRPDGRLHTEAVAGFDGYGLTVQAENHLRDLVGRWRPPVVVAAARTASEAVLRRVLANVEGTKLHLATPADQARAVTTTYEAIASRRLIHPPDALLAGHIHGLEPGTGGFGGLHRRSPGLDIDAAAAMILAVGTVDTFRPEVLAVPAIW